MKRKDDKSEKKDTSFHKSFLIFTIFVLCIIIVCFFVPDLGIPFLLGSIIMGILLCCFIGADKLRKIENYDKLNMNQEAMKNIKIPPNMPLPCVIINLEGKVLLYNPEFKNIFKEKEIKNSSITTLFPDYQFHVNKQIVKTNKFSFDVYSQKYDVIDKKREINQTTYCLCFVDVSQNEVLERKIELQKTVAALIFIDNYEEVLESLEESSLPLLTALIDRKLNSLALSVGGIVKKFEKDRYLFLLSFEKLEEMKEKKFEILNEIREIHIGEHIPVTLSIGVGIGWESLEEAMKSARTAIDLALGRGGDQALIKDGEKYLFYGGKSGEISHNARIRARVKADALWELMTDASDILVMGHKKADLDSLGSAIGICAMARTIKKPCHIVMDTISAGVKGLYEYLKQSDSYEDLFYTNLEAMQALNDKTLVIITDTHRQSLVECEKILEASKKIVVLDHHRKSTDFIEKAVLIYHEPYASSTSELVTDMLQYMGEKIKLKVIEADALLAGITLDTKNFSIKTGAITFETAAYLKHSGADSIRVRQLFQNDIEVYKAKAAAIQNVELFQENIAISICPSHSENVILACAQAADDLLNVKNIKASFVLCQIKNMIYISARSFGEINVQLIMEKIGGGGHLNVSGAQMEGITIEQAKEKIEKAIIQYLQEE